MSKRCMLGAMWPRGTWGWVVARAVWGAGVGVLVAVFQTLGIADPALARHGVPFALHVYPKGAHGIGLGTREWNPGARHPWTTECARWLREQSFAR